MATRALSEKIRFELLWRLATLGNGFRDAVVYRIEFFIELFGSAMVPATFQLVLWWALFQQSGVSLVGGRTHHELVLYTAVSTLFTQIRGGDHDFELQEMIRSGQLSQYLLRPVGVVEFVYLRGVVPRLLAAALCFAIGLVLIPALGVSGVAENAGRLSAAMALALLGNAIHYQIGSILAATAFYWEEAYSVLMVKNMLVSLLSGELIPLSLFPQSYGWAWKYTPFYIYVYGPTEIALGHWGANEILRHFGVALAWFAGCFFLIRVVWKIGLRKYSSLGG